MVEGFELSVFFDDLRQMADSIPGIFLGYGIAMLVYLWALWDIAYGPFLGTRHEKKKWKTELPKVRRLWFLFVLVTWAAGAFVYGTYRANCEKWVGGSRWP